MALGQFGGASEDTARVRQGGEGGSTLLDQARDRLIPSPEGQPASSSQMYLPAANYAGNLARNGSFESWSNGTTSAPDGWTLTGAGASVARNTTDVQRDLASVDVTAALNTATDLAQSLTIGASQNTHLRGRTVTFSCLVKAGAESRVFLRIDDGVTTLDSFFHTGGGAFELLYVTKRIDSAATKIECSLEISSGASITASFDAAMLAEGNAPVGFGYHIIDLMLIPRTIEAGSRQTRTSATLADLDSMSLANVILNGRQSVVVEYLIIHANDTAGVRNYIRVDRNGTALPGSTTGDTIAAADPGDHTNSQTMGVSFIDKKPAAGNYTYKLQWGTDGGTAAIEERVLSITVFPDE